MLPGVLVPIKVGKSWFYLPDDVRALICRRPLVRAPRYCRPRLLSYPSTSGATWQTPALRPCRFHLAEWWFLLDQPASAWNLVSQTTSGVPGGSAQQVDCTH